MSYWQKNYEYAQFDMVLILSENMLWVEPTYVFLGMYIHCQNEILRVFVSEL